MSYPPPSDPSVPPPGEPVYPPPGQSAYPSAGEPAYPPAAVVAPKLAPTWTGVLIALGGVLTAVAAFLQFEKVTFSGGSYAFTGVGAETTSGAFDADQLTPGGAGKVILVLGVIVLVLGALIVIGQGRIWISILTLVLAAVGVVLGVAAVTATSRDADTLSAAATTTVTGSVGIGAVLATVGMAVAVVFSLVAMVARRRVG